MLHVKWMFALGFGWTVAGMVWTWLAERRIRRLEAKDLERDAAETSTVIRKPGRRSVWTKLG